MATFVVLGTFTDEGVKDIRNLRQNVEQNIQRGRDLGMNIRSWLLTMGAYDFVVIVDGPDDEAMVAQAIGVASRGRSRTHTLRAFSLDEVDAIIQRLG